MKILNNAKKAAGTANQGIKTGKSIFKAADTVTALQGSASNFLNTMRNNASIENFFTGGSAVLGDIDKAVTQFGTTKKDVIDLFN